MSMLIQQALTNIFFAWEMLVASLLFFHAYRKRKHWFAVFAGGMAAIALSAMLLRSAENLIMSKIEASGIASEIFHQVYGITLIANLLLTTLVVFIIRGLYQTTWKNIFFIAVTASVVRTAFRSCFALVSAARGLQTSHMWTLLFSDITGLPVYLVVYAAVFLTIWLIFLQDYKEADDELIPGRVLFALCITALLCILFANINAPRTENEYILYRFLLFSEILIALLILVLQFYALNWFRIKLNQAMLSELYHSNEKQYVLSKESMDAVNIGAHDLKHKVIAILNALNGQGQEDLRAELSGLSEAVSDWESIYQTGNQPLDIVLTEKARKCSELSTELSVVADGKAISFLRDLDIYSLFSNALDNAIEAVSQIPDTEKRLIMVTVGVQNGFAVLHFENTFKEKPITADCRFVTSKADKTMHGFGIRSMENTVRQYNGHMEIDITDILFRLIFVIPVPESAV